MTDDVRPPRQIEPAEHRLVEEELRREKAYFEQLFESAQEAIVMADNAGTIRHVNGEFTRIFGYDPDEARGRRVDQLIAFDDQLAEALALTADAARGQRAEVEAIRRRKDGSSVDVSILTAPIVIDDEQVGVFGIYRDITARKRRDEERRRWEAQVQHMQKLESLGVLAGGIAHDFNNILTGVICNAELALVKKETDPEALGKLLEGIKQASVRAADLCRQMLAYSGKGSFVIEFIDLSRLVHDMTSMLEISISRRADIELRLPGDLPPVLGDGGQISQVIMNLITNASDALGADPGTITVTTRLIDALEEGSWSYVAGSPSGSRFVTMEVTDTGCGMSEENLERIFDPFFTTKFTGRGLGLSAVLGIVRGHSGIIRLRTSLGRGTTIQVLFPAKEGQVTAVQSLWSLRQLHGWRGEGTVLVVDDEDFVQEAVASILEQLGFEVARASSGREAIELFRAQGASISCVLLDLTLPELDGEETFRALRRIRDDVPVILMSGYGERELAARHTESGVAGFIQKPFLMRTLTEVLRAALEGDRAG